MTPAGNAMARVIANLQDVREYFDDRADAEYFTDRAEPVPNEEARLLVTVDECIETLERMK